MHRENIQIKVGVFILIAFSIISSVIFLLGKERNLFTNQFTVYADFADISGLRMGAPVYLAGLNVGQVDGIQFQQDLRVKKIRVKLRINRNYQDRVRQDTVASIQSQGLLGDKLVFLSVGNAVVAMVEDGAILQAEAPTDLYAFIEKGSRLLDSVNQAINKIQVVLEGIEGGEDRGNLSGTLKSLRGIMSEVEAGDGFIHDLIYNPHDEIMNDMAELSRHLKETSANLSEVSLKIKQGEGSLGGLIQDPTVYYDLKTLLGNANRNKLLKGIIRTTIEKREQKTIGGEK